MLTESRLSRGMPESPPSGLVCRKQYPGRKQRNIFAPELCTEKALQYQRPNFGAEFLFCRRDGSDGGCCQRGHNVYRAKNGKMQKNTIVCLSRIPNLRSSKCHVIDGLAGLATSCPSLKIG